MSLPATLLQASELGIRLEIVNGPPLWEAKPVYRHQKLKIPGAWGRVSRSKTIGPVALPGCTGMQGERPSWPLI